MFPGFPIRSKKYRYKSQEPNTAIPIHDAKKLSNEEALLKKTKVVFHMLTT